MIGKLPVSTLLTLLLAVTACQKQPLAEPAPDALDPTSEYIIVFGDIQGYTVSSSAMKWYTSTQHWIQTAQHRYGNIRCVLHVGDTTEHNQEAEWLRFWDATDSTAKVVPFYNAIGNHDYEWDWQGYIPDRDATFFTTYSSFPQTLAHVEEAFEPGRLENVVMRNEIFGERLDILILEFGARDEVRAWANSVLEAHPDRQYILLTHEFLTRDGQQDGAESYGSRLFKNSTSCSPQTLWDEVVYPHDNVLCVLCGHNGFTAECVTPNAAGREVHQVLFNLQNQKNGGNGLMELWEFPSGSDEVRISIYDTRNASEYRTDGMPFHFRFRKTEIN